jgi:hypothetical protein
VAHIALPLALHPSCGATPVTSIRVKVERTGTALQAHFRIEGRLDYVRIPAPAAARRADDLWRHTCCEVFVASESSEVYREFNFSPSGEWAAYGFDSYRKPAGNLELEPRTRVKSGEGFLELDAEMPGTGEGRIAVAAVIEDNAGQLSYWAARHPPGKPDFHHRDGFILKLG